LGQQVQTRIPLKKLHHGKKATLAGGLKKYISGHPQSQKVKMIPLFMSIA
jgi:hypothetical protein